MCNYRMKSIIVLCLKFKFLIEYECLKLFKALLTKLRNILKYKKSYIVYFHLQFV